MDVKLVDPTKDLDVYDVSTDRDKVLLSLIRKFHAYFTSGLGTKRVVSPDFPQDFKQLHEWTKLNKDAATQLSSVFMQEVVFKSGQKNMSKYVQSHVQVFEEWGIDLNQVIHKAKGAKKKIWRRESKDNLARLAKAKRALYEEVMGDDVVSNIIKSLGMLDLASFENLLASESKSTQAVRRFKKFLNKTPGRGKTSDDLKLLMLVQRSIMSLGSTWGIRGINLISLSFDMCTFDKSDNFLTYEYINNKSGKDSFICLRLHANADLCPLRHLAELTAFTSVVRPDLPIDSPFLHFYGGTPKNKRTETQNLSVNLTKTLLKNSGVDTAVFEGFDQTIHFLRYLVRNKLQSQGVSTDSVASFQSWSLPGSIMEMNYTDSKTRAIHNPAALAAVGRSKGEPHDPIYDFLDRVPSGLLDQLASNIPPLLKQIFIVSLASGHTSSTLAGYFSNVTGHQEFKGFKLKVRAHANNKAKQHQKQGLNSVPGLKNALKEFEIANATKDAALQESHNKNIALAAEIERLKAQLLSTQGATSDTDEDTSSVNSSDSLGLKRLRSDDAPHPGLAPTVTKRVKHDWSLDDVRESLGRIRTVKNNSVEYLDKVRREFDQTLCPAIDAVKSTGLSRAEFGIATNNKDGKQLIHVLILGAILKRASNDNLIRHKRDVNSKRLHDNPKSKEICWPKFAKQQAGAYNVDISSWGNFKSSIELKIKI